MLFIFQANDYFKNNKKTSIQMRENIMRSFLLFAVILTVMAATNCSYFAEPAATVSIPSIFADNMVLQQDTTVPIWGKASPGGKVTVFFQGQKKGTVAEADSQWLVELHDLTAGGPFELKVVGKNTLKLANVMVGEVWVCSGQSNMEMPLAGWGEINDYAREISEANYPNIRLFQVNHTMSLRPREDVDAQTWAECSPQTIPLFSATAYFFGRKLHQDLNVPIGLIHTSWGGTPAEAWTAAGFLAQLPDYAPMIESLQAEALSETDAKTEYERQVSEWQKLVDLKVSKALQGATSWHDVDLDESGWQTMKLPVLWESAGLPNFDGIVWFRKTIELPPTVATEICTLSLGPIDDQDITYVNGVEIGATDGYNSPRVYTVPAGLLHEGANIVAVQVLDTGGGGGLWGADEQMFLKSGSRKTYNLFGDWKYKVGVSLQDVPPRPVSPDSPNRPTILYNAMLEPLMPFAIRGAIWYQGEANASRAYQYRTLFPAMINSWRADWGIGDFPFLFVQLANYNQSPATPGESDWAELREAQLMTLSLPNTGMAVTIDIGNADDIHPKDKQDVGKRLALNALATVYGQDIEYSGPIYKSMSIEDGKIRLTFDHVGSGLVAGGGDKLTGFAIAGEDKQFVWADAVIDGNTIVVSSPQVPSPVAVRYGWASDPTCNLYNQEGLPASPFRTDDWPGITQGVK
jgi:sialate O-acetylesterase